MFVQKPPTAQNYGVSTTGSFSTSFPKSGPQGHVEMKTGTLVPSSLYEAQLCDRLEASTPPTPTPTPTPVPQGTPTPTPTPGGSGEITPSGSAVTASTNDGNLPANAVDNSLATRWSASGDNQWIRFDLGTTRTVSHVRIATYQGNTRRTRFDIQASTDGASWSNVITAAETSGTTTAEETFDFTDVSARWVRYMGHGNTANMWNSVTELSIFGR